jgi:hypothetical protein
MAPAALGHLQLQGALKRTLRFGRFLFTTENTEVTEEFIGLFLCVLCVLCGE